MIGFYAGVLLVCIVIFSVLVGWAAWEWKKMHEGYTGAAFPDYGNDPLP
jgi:hypothetical protein